MTAPTQITASRSPDSASRLATSGISNAPGTHTTGTESSSSPMSASSRSAPSRRSLVTSSLKRLATTATRMPEASRLPSNSVYSPISAAMRLTAAQSFVLDFQQVAHLLLLGAQVRDVLVGRPGPRRHPVDDLEAVSLEAPVLGRVVRHDPHCRDPEVDEDLRPDPVLARVDREAELYVGLDGVAPLVLERVRAQLVTEADPAALVPTQVDDDALVLFGDAFEREVELQSAIAPDRAEHVAGQALGVDSHEHVGLPRHLAADERHVLGSVEQRLEHVRRELSVLRRNARLRDAADELLALTPVPDEVGDRDEVQVVPGGEPLELRQPGHRAVVVHHLREHARGREAGEAGEVDGRLGVAGPLEHAAFPVPQREDVAGASEIVGLCLRIDERVHRRRA